MEKIEIHTSKLRNKCKWFSAERKFLLSKFLFSVYIFYCVLFSFLLNCLKYSDGYCFFFYLFYYLNEIIVYFFKPVSVWYFSTFFSIAQRN